MKVLVPVDVKSKRGFDEAINAILDNAWPDDAAFHIFNVIEGDKTMPCGEPGCEKHCRCVSSRVRVLSSMMRRLENKLPHYTPVFVEVVRGDVQDEVNAWLDAHPGSQLLLTRPLPDKRARKKLNGSLAAISIAALSAGVAIALATLGPAPAGGFVPVVPTLPAKPPAVVAGIVRPKPVPVKAATPDELRLDVFARLGDANVDSEDWWRAILNYRQALMYWRKAKGSQARLSSITGGMSIAYFELGQKEQATEFGKQSLAAALASDPKNMIDISVAYNNLGYIYRATRSFNEAQKCYEQALRTAPTMIWEGRVRAATIEANLAEVYALSGQIEKALTAYRHALLVIRAEMPNNRDLINEINQRIRILELHRPVAMAKWPLSVHFIKSEI